MLSPYFVKLGECMFQTVFILVKNLLLKVIYKTRDTVKFCNHLVIMASIYFDLTIR